MSSITIEEIFTSSSSVEEVLKLFRKNLASGVKITVVDLREAAAIFFTLFCEDDSKASTKTFLEEFKAAKIDSNFIQLFIHHLEHYSINQDGVKRRIKCVDLICELYRSGFINDHIFKCTAANIFNDLAIAVTESLLECYEKVCKIIKEEKEKWPKFIERCDWFEVMRSNGVKIVELEDDQNAMEEEDEALPIDVRSNDPRERARGVFNKILQANEVDHALANEIIMLCKEMNLPNFKEVFNIELSEKIIALTILPQSFNINWKKVENLALFLAFFIKEDVDGNFGVLAKLKFMIKNLMNFFNIPNEPTAEERSHLGQHFHQISQFMEILTKTLGADLVAEFEAEVMELLRISGNFCDKSGNSLKKALKKLEESGCHELLSGHRALAI